MLWSRFVAALGGRGRREGHGRRLRKGGPAKGDLDYHEEAECGQGRGDPADHGPFCLDHLGGD